MRVAAFYALPASDIRAIQASTSSAVRVIPVIGKTEGEVAEFGGLLGYAPIMPVHRESCKEFIRRGGRIPAPIHSLRN